MCTLEKRVEFERKKFGTMQELNSYAHVSLLHSSDGSANTLNQSLMIFVIFTYVFATRPEEAEVSP